MNAFLGYYTVLMAFIIIEQRTNPVLLTCAQGIKLAVHDNYYVCHQFERGV